jgi:hypothetical protein
MNFSHLTSEGYLPTMLGDPFSAITPSMWPQDIIQQLHCDERRRHRRAEQISSTSSTDSAGDASNCQTHHNVHPYSCAEGMYLKKVDWNPVTDNSLLQFDVFGFSLDEERGENY